MLSENKKILYLITYDRSQGLLSLKSVYSEVVRALVVGNGTDTPVQKLNEMKVWNIHSMHKFMVDDDQVDLYSTMIKAEFDHPVEFYPSWGAVITKNEL